LSNEERRALFMSTPKNGYQQLLCEVKGFLKLDEAKLNEWLNNYSDILSNRILKMQLMFDQLRIAEGRN